MKIGELARRTLHTAETIRYYERMGLLPAPRRFANNSRDYGEVHVGRLEFIRHCRTLDISLDEIRSLLESIEDGSPEGADRAHVMIHRHLEAVEARMAELRRLREQLCSLAGACCGRHAEGELCGLSAFRILTPQKTVRTGPEKKAKIIERPVRKAVRTNVLV